jgi:hypothetical protein
MFLHTPYFSFPLGFIKHPDMKVYGEVTVQLHTFLNFMTHEGEQPVHIPDALLYPCGNSLFPLQANVRVNGSQIQFGHLGKQSSPLPPPEIEIRFPGKPACSPVTTFTSRSVLSLVAYTAHHLLTLQLPPPPKKKYEYIL